MAGLGSKALNMFWSQIVRTEHDNIFHLNANKAIYQLISMMYLPDLSFGTSGTPRPNALQSSQIASGRQLGWNGALQPGHMDFWEFKK